MKQEIKMMFEVNYLLLFYLEEELVALSRSRYSEQSKNQAISLEKTLLEEQSHANQAHGRVKAR